MALQKDLEISGTGITASYNKIEKIVLNCTSVSNTVEIRVMVYKDKAARDGGKAPATSKNIKVRGDSYETYFSEDVLKAANVSLVGAAYGYLKTLEAYSGASDV